MVWSPPRTAAIGPAHPGFPNQPPFRVVDPAVTLITNSGDGGSEGTNVSTGNSGGGSGTAFAVVSAGAGNTITYTIIAAIHGLFGFLFTKGATPISVLELRDTGTGVAGSTSVGARCYLNMRDGLPSADAAQLGMQLRSTLDAQMGRVQITAAGFLQITSSTAVQATGTVPLTPGAVYRLEGQWSGLNTGAGVIDAQVFAQDSLIPLDAVTATGVTQLGLADRVRFGNTGATAVPTYIMDSLAIRIGSNLPIGPLLSVFGDPPPAYQVPARRRLVFWPGRARRPATPVLVQAAAPAAPPFVPDPARVLRRVAAVRRSRSATAPVPQVAPPAAPARRRGTAPLRRRAGVQVTAVPGQTPAVPGGQQGRRLVRVFTRSRPDQAAVPIAQVVAPPVNPAYPITPGRVRRALVGRRRPATVVPVPAQIVPPAAPVYPVAAATRVRRALLPARRRPAAVPVPVQAPAPAAPVYVDPTRARRRVLAGALRRRPAATVPDQMLAPAAPPAARRRFLPARRRPVPAVPPVAQVAAPPVYPRQPVRRRLLGILLRRPRPVADPVRPGNPNVLVPKPPVLEPGARPAVTGAPGARGGPGAAPGTRSSSTGIPGGDLGAHNEPGTRSGPTITGGGQ